MIHLERNPILVDYFSENIQLLYSLERMKESIQTEMISNDFVQPCYFKHTVENDVDTIKYANYCYHKSKKYIHYKKLLDQAEALIQEPSNLNEFNRNYLIDAL